MDKTEFENQKIQGVPQGTIKEIEKEFEKLGLIEYVDTEQLERDLQMFREDTIYVHFCDLPEDIQEKIAYMLAEQLALGKRAPEEIQISKHIRLRRPIICMSLERMFLPEVEMFKDFVLRDDINKEEYEKEKSEGKNTVIYIGEEDAIHVYDAKENKEYVFDISYKRERNTSKEAIEWLARQLQKRFQEDEANINLPCKVQI